MFADEMRSDLDFTDDSQDREVLLVDAVEAQNGANQAITGNHHRDEAIKLIEEMALSFLAQLCRKNAPHKNSCEPEDGSTQIFPVKNKRKRIELQLANRRKLGSDGSLPLRRLQFPKSSQQSGATNFARLFRALDITHKALVHNIPTTKRDIYYRDVELFGSQGVVDRLVDDLAATFNLERSDLNVRAASKGLVCGSALVIRLLGGESIEANNSEGTLIPAGEVIEEFVLTQSIGWVLIVEKEAIFQTLCRLNLTCHDDLPGQGIMITGKGYPDVATREFVKTLAENLPASVPILALVDADPYGLDILSVYKFGSFAMRHENDKLAAGRIEWLGVWGSELAGLGIEMDRVISLTEHDKKKAYAMLKRQGMPGLWRRELLQMLQCGQKAEIEIIYSLRSEHGDPPRRLADGAEEGTSQWETTAAQPREDSGVPPDEKHPLLVYLSRKITQFVGNCSSA